MLAQVETADRDDRRVRENDCFTHLPSGAIKIFPAAAAPPPPSLAIRALSPSAFLPQAADRCSGDAFNPDWAVPPPAMYTINPALRCYHATCRTRDVRDMGIHQKCVQTTLALSRSIARALESTPGHRLRRRASALLRACFPSFLVNERAAAERGRRDGAWRGHERTPCRSSGKKFGMGIGMEPPPQ